MKSKKVVKYFKGKTVGIVTRGIRGTHNNGSESFSGNHVLEGIWSDDDNCFIFLSDINGNIVDSIHKKDIIRIFIPQQETIFVDADSGLN